jgi:hypothetical protein
MKATPTRKQGHTTETSKIETTQNESQISSQVDLGHVRESLLQLVQQYSDEELSRSTASISALNLQNVEIGYFQTLNANFRSTEEEIRKYASHSHLYF